jgi:putative addiction module CopG family antidote
MRTTINISMPPAVKKNIDRMIKEEEYASVSELFRDALRALEEDQLIRSIEQSEREFASGKGKVLRSLKDLM